MILPLLLAMLASRMQRHRQQVVTYLQVENRMLKARLGSPRLPLTDTERRRLAAFAYPLGRKRLQGDTSGVPQGVDQRLSSRGCMTRRYCSTMDFPCNQGIAGVHEGQAYAWQT